MLIDCHCHLEMIDNYDEAVKDAKEKGVGIIISSGVNPEKNRIAMQLAEESDIVKACPGMYPIDALELTDKEISKEMEFIEDNRERIIAIGEIGLDFKEDDKEHEKQKEIFRKFIDLAIELDKPMIVHSRKAEKECIEVLEEMKAKKVIMHCFSGNMNLVSRIADNGWFLTIPGNVLSSQHFQKVIENTDISQLLCETDSPYLHPRRRWPNTPGNVIESYKKIAEIKKIELKEAEKQIENNFRRLFLS